MPLDQKTGIVESGARVAPLPPVYKTDSKNLTHWAFLIPDMKLWRLLRVTVGQGRGEGQRYGNNVRLPKFA